MMNCSFTVSLKTANFIMIIADSLSALIVKSTVTLSKSVMTFKNAASVLLQNIIIMTAHSKAVFSFTAVSTAILSI